MEFWKKWINVALVFIMTLSLLSPGAVQAEGQGDAQQNESSEETVVTTSGTEVTSPDSAGIVVDEAVSDVQELIDALPTVEQANEETELALQAARVAYDALTIEQQALVTNLNELVEKEEAFLALQVKPQIVEKTINFRVEGYKGTHLNLKDVLVTGTGEITAAEATKQILEANGIDSEYNPSTGYFSSIAEESEKALGVGSGWLYKVNGVYPDVYSKDVTIKDGDEIVWDYINSTSVMEDFTYSGITIMYSGAESVDKITFHPIINLPEVIQVGQDLTISVTGKYNTLSYIYEKVSGPVTIDLADVSVEYNGKTYVTDSNGLVKIPGQEVIAGEFILRFTKDLPGTIHSKEGNKELDSFPRIIRTYKTIKVQEVSEDAGEIQPEPSNPEETPVPGGESTPSEQNDFRTLAEQAIEQGKNYLVTNKELVSLRVNESHSGYWMLSAMFAVGADIKNFPWTTAPIAEGTHWTIPLEERSTDGNELLGTVIGANFLGLNATNIKNRNFVADLLANKNANGMYTTLWGEPWAMVAWTLQGSDQYDLTAHLKFPIAMQNATTTGYIATLDLTGWWLIALAPYRNEPGIEAVIQKAVAGYHQNFQANGFLDNANTMAAIISGLASVGEDLFSEKWTYEKDGQKVNIIGHLVENYVMEGGGVRWKATDTKSNLMALEQVYIALGDALHQKSTFVRFKEQQPQQPEVPEVNGDSKLAEQVEALITALPSIEALNETTQLALQQARAAYNALTEEQKLLVGNLPMLAEKENAYASLVKVEEVIEKIKALVEVDNVTWADNDKVQQVVTAYNTLTATEKTAVTIKEKLEALQTRLKALTPIVVKSFTLGDKFVTLPKIGDSRIVTVKFNPTTTTQTGLTWVSSNEQVVTVKDGEIVAVGLGEATITVTSENEALKPTEIKLLVGMELQEAYTNAQKYIANTVTAPKYNNEWAVFTLARSNAAVASTYFDTYYTNIVDHVQSKKGTLSNSYTDYSRLVIGLVAAGKDPRDVGGYNLLEKLADYKNVAKTVNGAIYGLIALDTHSFDVPQVEGVELTTREKLVDAILAGEIEGGGFAFSGKIPDPDMTAMALQALAPYKAQEKVQAAIDRGLTILSTIQLANGGYRSSGAENVQSPAQVLVALSALGIDATTDARFIKDNRATILSNMLTYYTIDGGFKHGGTTNAMATQQATYGLSAYYRMLSGKTALYNMSDVEFTEQSETPKDLSEGSEQTGGTQPTQPEKPTTPPALVADTVTMSITISTSEVVLPSEQFDIQSDETAFDVLKRVTQQKQIALNYRQSSMGYYVAGIGGVNEFDRGNLSGWMYRVNGTYPDVSADAYLVQSDDRIEWLYTTNLGEDIGGNSENSTGTGSAKDEAPTLVTDKAPTLITDEENVVLDQPGSETEKIAIIEANQNAEQLEAEITAEMITEQIKEDVKKIVIQDSKGTKVELPTASLKLTAGEKLVVAVNQQVDTKVFKVNVAVVTQNGATKSPDIAKGYIKVTIPAPDTTANTVVLQLVNGEYRAVPHKIVNGEIVLLVKSSGEFIVSEEKVTFADISKLANKDDIEFLANRHVITGKDAENFAPNAAITRGQFAAMISRALGLQAAEDGQFKDTAGKWYASDIQALFEAGITTGKTADTFDPEAGMTRGQGAAFMARVLTYVDYQASNTNELSFTDAEKISKQFQESIALLQSLDIMSGKDDGTFDEGGTLTRAQMAKILKRTLIEAGLM